MKAKTILKLTLPLFVVTVTILYAFNLNLPGKIVTRDTDPANQEYKQLARLKKYGETIKKYASKNDYNNSLCFLVDMKIHSGKNRFFIFDLNKNAIISSALVAHGSCNNALLVSAKFSNTEGAGCTALGKYAVLNKYQGKYGTAFKLKGLDSSNSNAYKRFVVLHAYGCIPDVETYPIPACNSLGCPMVSYKFLSRLEKEIKASKQPVLMWIFA